MPTKWLKSAKIHYVRTCQRFRHALQEEVWNNPELHARVVFDRVSMFEVS